MGLIDSIINAGKFLIGTGLGIVIILAGIMTAGTTGGTVGTLIAIGSLIIGIGLVLWGEKSRRSALRPRRPR